MERAANFPAREVFVYVAPRARKLRGVYFPMNSLLLPLAALSLESFGAMVLYALAGIGLAIAGYKIFDRCTPGDLHEEILKNRNTAAAIVSAAVILGVCVIIAAAIVG